MNVKVLLGIDIEKLQEILDLIMADGYNLKTEEGFKEFKRNHFNKVD